MIKGKTSLQVFIEFISREGRIPTRQEFMDCGYCSRSYYNAKEQYYDYIKARVEEKQEGGNPLATYEDDIAEGFIKG